MEIVLVILTVLVSVLLIIVVLIQKSKGSGLSSQFAGSNQIMGVRRTTDFIEKATWTLAIIIMGLSILATIIATKNNHAKKPSTIAPQTEQAAPATFPTEEPAADVQTLPVDADAAVAEEAAVEIAAENSVADAQ